MKTPSFVEGIKFDNHKISFDLVPVLPLLSIVRVLTYGKVKYGDRNWEKGMSWGRLYSAMCRHIFAFWGGESYDSETGIHHLAHACCDAMFLMEYERTHPELDDRTDNNRVFLEGEAFEWFSLEVAQSAKELYEKEKNKVAKELETLQGDGQK